MINYGDLALHLSAQMPPSANKIYFRGTSLTKTAREYKENFKQFAVQYSGHQIAKFDTVPVEKKVKKKVETVHQCPWIFHLYLDFYFESLENDAWPTRMNIPPSRRPKDRYKRIDLDNRIKFLTDCVRDVIAVDDSHIFYGQQRKYQDPIRPRVEIYVVRADPRWYGMAGE